MYTMNKPQSLPPLVHMQVDRAQPSSSVWVLNAYVQQLPTESKPCIEITYIENESARYMGFPLFRSV